MISFGTWIIHQTYWIVRHIWHRTIICIFNGLPWNKAGFKRDSKWNFQWISVPNNNGWIKTAASVCLSRIGMEKQYPNQINVPCGVAVCCRKRLHWIVIGLLYCHTGARQMVISQMTFLNLPFYGCCCILVHIPQQLFDNGSIENQYWLR